MKNAEWSCDFALFELDRDGRNIVGYSHVIMQEKALQSELQ